MNNRSYFAISLVIVAVIFMVGCEQLAGLQNNKTRIAGTWHPYRYSFKEDVAYDFAEGIIKRDGFGWGTYQFKRNSVIEVDVSGEATTYELEFPDDESMIWYNTDATTGEKIVKHTWKR